MLALKVVNILKCIKYWFKILLVCVGDDRLPKHCYLMSKRLDDVGRVTWASKITHVLFTLGFEEVWLEQGVGNIQLFLEIFKQRVKEVALLDWSNKCNENAKLSNFVNFKGELATSPSLMFIRSKYVL